MKIDLSGQVAVVTGAASGIGRATAVSLAASGAKVAALDRNADGLAELVTELGPAVRAYPVDLLDREAVRALGATVTNDLGPVNIVVNAAGWDIIQRFLDNTPEYWDTIVGLNLMAPIEVTRAFLEDMAARKAPGRIINIASDAGRVGSSGEVVYAGAKGGVIAFGKALARETARFGITVNSICPGPTDTPLFRSQEEAAQQALIKATPMRRLAKPDEVAALVTYFASDHAAFITGQVISVSGGLTMAG